MEEDFSVLYYDHAKPKFNQDLSDVDTENYAFERDVETFYQVPSASLVVAEDVTLAPQDAINSFEFPIQQLSFADDTQAVVLEEEEDYRPVRPVFQPLPINLNLDEDESTTTGTKYR